MRLHRTDCVLSGQSGLLVCVPVYMWAFASVSWRWDVCNQVTLTVSLASLSLLCCFSAWDWTGSEDASFRLWARILTGRGPLCLPCHFHIQPECADLLGVDPPLPVAPVLSNPIDHMASLFSPERRWESLPSALLPVPGPRPASHGQRLLLR